MPQHHSTFKPLTKLVFARLCLATRPGLQSLCLICLASGEGEAKECKRKPPSPFPGPLPLSAFSPAGRKLQPERGGAAGPGPRGHMPRLHGPPTSNGVKRHMVKAKNGAAICLLGAMRNTFFQKDIWTGRKTWVPYVFWRQGKNEFLEKDIWSGRKTWRPYVIWQWRKKKLLEIDIWSEQKTRAPYVIWQ